MKHSLFLVPMLVAMVCSASHAQTETITILHVNDTHSCLAPGAPRNADLSGNGGGMARAATIIAGARLTAPNPIILHAGDFFIGDIFFNTYFGVPELALMKQLGFDAMAVGNHEFDLTPAVLLASLDSGFAAGGFPLLSANLILEDPLVSSLKKYIHPYIIKQAGSVKVGIFGMTTPSTNLLSQPAPAVIDTSIVQIAAAMVDTLQAQGCKLVICLSHLGVDDDQRVASNVSGIDVIVGGHDHLLLDPPLKIKNPSGNNTLILQANAFYQNIGELTLVMLNGKVTSTTYSMIKLDSSVPEEIGTKAVIDSLIAGIEAIYGPLFSKQIGYASSDFEEVASSLMTNGPKDTPIGDLVTDAFRSTLQTDIAIEVGGSTAQKLCKGPIVADDLFRVVGYGFNTINGLGYHLARFTMKGTEILKGLEFGLSDIEHNDEFLVQSAGLKYSYNSSRPVGSRVASVTVGGTPLDTGKIYSLAANEFVPLILGEENIEADNVHICGGDTTEFQTLAAYVSALGTISPDSVSRVVSPVFQKPAAAPEKFSLGLNYPNPFNPTTTIRFTIDRSQFVTLKVYDVLGKEVATLVNGPMGQGAYEVQWHASDYPSGVYFSRLQGEKDCQVRKLMLLK